MKHVLTSLKLFGLLSLITGIVYPVFVTLTAGLIWKTKAKDKLNPTVRRSSVRSSNQLNTFTLLFLCDWFRGLIADVKKDIVQEADDHAGEVETSLGLACFGHLVKQHDDGTLAADDGTTQSTRFDAVNRGWVSITRPWHLLTTNTGSGNPHGATAEKGARLMEIMVERLGGFLVDLAQSKVDEKFPF